MKTSCEIYYNNNSEDFNITQAFEVQEITFATALENTLFNAQLAQGVDLSQALADSTAGTQNQGLRAIEDLDEAEAAFIAANSLGSLSEPRVGDDGRITYLYFADERAAQELTFDQARDQVETAVRLDNARTLLGDTIDDLQASYADGAIDLAGLAEAAGTDVQTLQACKQRKPPP